MPLPRRTLTVATLGTTQTLAWASSYYLIAMLAAPMARDMGVAPATPFAAFSAALLVSAALGPQAGKAIDRFGGRPVLLASNAIFAAGLLALAYAGSTVGFFLAWAVLGLGMGCGLYEAAFATVVRLYGRDARGAITGITLFAGFASTVGWPLTTWLEAHWGWRGACLAWAGLHLALALPLNASLPRAPDPPAAPVPADLPATAAPENAATGKTALLLAWVFAATWCTSTAMAAHLPALLLAAGTTLAGAVSIAALVGPAQVAGRLLEFGFLKRAGPLLSARLATLAHPLGVVLLLLAGTPAAAVFAVLHGMGNGIMTIAIGTLPLVLFGPAGYGRRQGLLMVPARVLQAGAPFLFGLAVERWGVWALCLTAALALSGCLALLLVSPRREP
ncbi:MAG: MFS transporter [Pseudomonadota bacterium]